MALPDIVTKQLRLLTVSASKGKFLEGLLQALHQGLKQALDPHNGVWLQRVKFVPGVTLPLHFHTGTEHIFTMSGAWYYTD